MEKVIITLIVCCSAVMVLRVICGTILAMHAQSLMCKDEEPEARELGKEGGIPPVANNQNK